MPKPQQLPSGKYRVQLTTPAGRRSKTFSSRANATKWLRKVEHEIDVSKWKDSAKAERTTFAAIGQQYIDKVLPHHKSGKITVYTIRRLIRWFGGYRLTQITPAVVADWKEHRLEQVSNGTVRREMIYLRVMLKTAINEWDCHLPHGNPVLSIRLPPAARPRDRRPTEAEVTAIVEASESAHLSSIILLGIESAMRRSEMTLMVWEWIDLIRRLVTLPDEATKTGVGRQVPLSTKATALLRDIHQAQGGPATGRVFPLDPNAVTRAFIRARRRARAAYHDECRRLGRQPDPRHLEDLRLHDLRHEATSRLFERGFSVVEAQLVTGHKTLEQLMRYTHLKPESVLDKLG
ncbi:tyrosine-type recombinase/integrase [Guyparkeria sp.]|uniref:tyrosine-type recombinase/integrase n=1 Tax=Guyparkeria sp. TaxID=2035736 RepID=UPI0039706D4C